MGAARVLEYNIRDGKRCSRRRRRAHDLASHGVKLTMLLLLLLSLVFCLMLQVVRAQDFNGELDPLQVGALRALGMSRIGLNACSVEPASVLTCNDNPVVQHLVTLSVQNCPPTATLSDIDFTYLSTTSLSQLSFINCNVAAPTEPPMVLMTSLLEFLLLNSLNPIPGWWLGRLHGLRNLTVVNVTVVVVEGLEVVLSNMNDLQFLTLQNANLFAPLPVKSWPANLNSIALSGSDILGTIPASLSELTHLENLDLSNNQLNGHIPSSLGELQTLQILSLAANRLTGPIPASFGNLSALQKLDLSFNSLNGTLPPALGQLRGLTDLDLRGNKLLGGAIPFPTNVLKNMKTFLVSGTNLCYDPILTSAELARGFSIPLCGR